MASKKLKMEIEDQLKKFLKGREHDIAINWEDFGQLKLVYNYYVGWNPNKEKE